ncbi:MAG: ankyrin repeat domain-containing protein, partial [Synergistaceae bacterium]|nr:ankyrin repeat domain-containing protein [Synergistaceae bacterium]
EDEGALLELRAKLQKDFLKICRSGTEDEIAEAVSAGVNVNVANKSSATALMFAAQSNTAQAIEILVHAGAALNSQDDKGNTALIYAASYNHDDVVEALIDAGADRDIRNLGGLKALDYAQRNYRLIDTEAVKRL